MPIWNHVTYITSDINLNERLEMYKCAAEFMRQEAEDALEIGNQEAANRYTDIARDCDDACNAIRKMCELDKTLDSLDI